MFEKYWYYVIGRTNKNGESKTSEGICASKQRHFPLIQIINYWKDDHESSDIYIKTFNSN